MAKEPGFKRLAFEPGTIIIEPGSVGEAAYLITNGRSRTRRMAERLHKSKERPDGYD